MLDRCETPAMRRNAWRYIGEMAICLALCVPLIFLSKRLLGATPDGVQRVAVALLPMLAILLTAAAVVRSILRLDEYQRSRMIAISAAAGGITVVVAFGYGLLESAGWPHRNMMFVWPVMSIAWAVCAFVDMWRRRHDPHARAA